MNIIYVSGLTIDNKEIIMRETSKSCDHKTVIIFTLYTIDI